MNNYATLKDLHILYINAHLYELVFALHIIIGSFFSYRPAFSWFQITVFIELNSESSLAAIYILQLRY